MKKFLKWIGIVFGVMIGLVVVFAGAMFGMGTSRLNKTYSIEPAPVQIPDGPDALVRGAYLYSTACVGCHGEDLAGTPFFDDPALGTIPAPNLTAGQGGAGRIYSDADFVRAIRHGVRADGTPLMIMPSKSFWYFSDEDLGAIIAYLRSSTPVDNDMGKKITKPMGRILLALGAFGDALGAEVIDHNANRPPAPARGVTTAYGEYLVNTRDCRNCHGETLSGAQPSEPGAPFAPNLTPGGVLATWSESGFIDTIRTGKTPYGRQLDGAFMPWEEFSRLTDEDLTAIFRYLQSLPAQETNAN